MFNELIQQTTKKLIDTLKIHKEVLKLDKKIDNLQHFKEDKIFYIGLRYDYKGRLYEQANNHLARNINQQLGFDYLHQGYNDKKSYKNLIKLAKNIKLDDVLDRFKKYTNGNGWHKEAPTIQNDIITLSLSDYYLRLLLNTINILKNDELENDDIFKKAYEVLKECNTFIYRNVKITVYKNGKTKLVFADKDLLNKFIQLIKGE